MIDQSHEQHDLTSGIFNQSKDGYRHPRAERKEFKPWHKPRKQFVRREQWLKLLMRLYEERNSGDPLRYLGLPGTDLLDLRYLHEKLCQNNDRKLRFLGFNNEARPGNSAHIELGISFDEIRQLKNVDQQSLVLNDDFRLIGDPNSVAWSHTRQLGPFDVVNIDLCDGLASDPPQNDESVYKALAQLIAFQSRNPDPWLLLITTRIGHRQFDAEAEKHLINLFKENACDCKGFAEACEKFLNFDARSVDPATCSETDHLNLMIVAIGKWLASLMQAQNTNRIELASTQGYRVEPNAAQEDLVSLALRVEPLIEASPDAFSPTAPTPRDECKTAMAILRRSTCRRDVDTILKQNPQLWKQSIDETEQLLKQARYDVSAYRPWLDRGCVRTASEPRLPKPGA